MGCVSTIRTKHGDSFIESTRMKKLKNGWVEGSVKEFLDLSDADVEYIETRRALSLSRLLKEARATALDAITGRIAA